MRAHAVPLLSNIALIQDSLGAIHKNWYQQGQMQYFTFQCSHFSWLLLTNLFKYKTFFTIIAPVSRTWPSQTAGINPLVPTAVHLQWMSHGVYAAVQLHTQWVSVVNYSRHTTAIAGNGENFNLSRLTF